MIRAYIECEALFHFLLAVDTKLHLQDSCKTSLRYIPGGVFDLALSRYGHRRILKRVHFCQPFWRIFLFLNILSNIVGSHPIFRSFFSKCLLLHKNGNLFFQCLYSAILKGTPAPYIILQTNFQNRCHNHGSRSFIK